MSRYGNNYKEELYDEMYNFVKCDGFDINDLLTITTDVVSDLYDQSIAKKVEDIRKEYQYYQDKYEQFKRIIGEQ